MEVPPPSLLQVPDTGDARDLYFMAHAFQEAVSAGQRGEVPVGAVVVLEDRILARAGNRCEELRDPTAHAEMLALTSACAEVGHGRLLDCELYCTLEPCFMCAGALLHARVGRLVFGARDPKFGACVSLAELPSDTRLNHRYPIREGVYADESAAMLRAFFAERRE